jgi:hypothetical protein
MEPRTRGSSPSINLTGGDQTVQIGLVQGDLKLYGVYADYARSGQSEEAIDITCYTRHLRETLSFWASRYTVLDVEPMVTVLSGLVSDTTRRVQVTEAISEFSRLVVLGNPGSGKTATLQFVARAMSDGYRPQGICILVDLGQFRVASQWSPLDCLLILIADRLQAGGASVQRPSLLAVERFLAANETLVLFDGLNEVTARNRAFCRQAIDDLAARYPRNRIVVTSRSFGFSPWSNWTTVVLQDLDQRGVEEFLSKYADGPTASHLLQVVLDSRNALLKLPLFLTYVIQLRSLPETELKASLQSRSGLILRYVEHVLDRRTKGASESQHSSLAELWSSLGDLADRCQNSGQTLPLEAVLECLRLRTSNEEGAKRLLAELCECGILVEDRRYIRFRHHTLQEFFYCSALVRRWHRKPLVSFKKVPPWLRKHFSNETEEEALKYFVAHLDAEDEIMAVVRYTATTNPRLASCWVDDVLAENRCPAIGRAFVSTIRNEAHRAIRYSILSELRGSAIRRLLFLCLAILLMLSVLGVSILTYAVVVGTLMFIFIDAVLHYRGRNRLESLLMPLVIVRNPALRAEMIGTAREVGFSALASLPMRQLSATLSALRLDDGLKQYMARRISLYDALTGLAHIDDTSVFPVLERLLKYNNLYARRAMQVLSVRANRFPTERELLKDVARKVVRTTPDWALLREARRFLKRCGEWPSRGSRVIFEPIARMLIFLVFLSGLISIGVLLHSIPGYLSISVESAIAWALSAWIRSDAQSIGATQTYGYRKFDGWSPNGYGIVVFFLSPLGAPAYLAIRDVIKRNGIPVGAEDLEQFITIGDVDQALQVGIEQVRAL